MWHFGGRNGLMAFTLISMGKFALSYKQTEVQGRSQNELNLHVKIPLYFVLCIMLIYNTLIPFSEMAKCKMQSF